MGKLTPLGGTIYFAVDCTLLTAIKCDWVSSYNHPPPPLPRHRSHAFPLIFFAILTPFPISPPEGGLWLDHRRGGPGGPLRVVPRGRHPVRHHEGGVPQGPGGRVRGCRGLPPGGPEGEGGGRRGELPRPQRRKGVVPQRQPVSGATTRNWPSFVYNLEKRPFIYKIGLLTKSYLWVRGF